MPRTLTRLFASLLLCLPLFAGGCATAAQATFSERPAPFGGTRLWGETLAFSADETFNHARPPHPIVLTALVDLPLSFASDLVLLPVTGVMELTSEEAPLVEADFVTAPR